MKKEACCSEFRKELGQAVGFVGKLSDDWECTAEVVREPVKKVFDISLVFKKEYKATW